RSEAEAANYRLPFARATERVMPERMQNKRKPRRDYWWLFAERAAGMRKAIADLSEVLVIALVSKTVMPVRVSAEQVFSHALGVFATDSYGDQAVLSSSLHQLWAITYGSGMRNDPRYTPSDVFETFPRPAMSVDLGEIGRSLDQERRDVMHRRELGLTRLYNLVNDSELSPSMDEDVDRLRLLHAELDQQVLDAYGWSDVDLNHGFHTHRRMERWTVNPSARVEILDRLLEENHRRAAPTADSTGRLSARVLQQEDTLFD
ncbi:type IIL restriction-modification enzyme MmeI, partial [Microbacterium sp. 179-I 3D2 NHS]|uniref:type IIL restriction-modification enzyme MmeI n=1 Tax=Microbacterium sp. 179-I 3D2 NHS TaxID=3235178 RepID=UPI0039A26D3C